MIRFDPMIRRGTAALALVLAAPVTAQSPQTDWSVFVQEDPAQCWVVSTPASTVATRNDQDVTASINRGEVMLFISFWPSDSRLGEVSYTGGYPFAPDSVVSVEIGTESFELFTEADMSWAASPQDDTQIIEALRSGSEVVLTASSARGTEVADTFSLVGFTAAIEDAETRCAP